MCTAIEPRLCSGDDLIQLNKELDLWLKPYALISIAVSLPTLNTLGKTISSWELMDKLKKKIKPYKFKSLKVSKSMIEFIRFEADCDTSTALDAIIARLNHITIKLTGFAESLKVKTAKIKLGATRHEWESYFRDNPHCNELKPGLRPDTIYVNNIPMKWFGGDKPNCQLLVKVFSVFGEIRRFHIPILDTINEANDSSDGFKRFSYNESLSFDAYIQYRDYIGFVKAMDALRAMKLVKQLSELRHQRERYLEYDMRVNFDKTRHLSDKAIKKRRIAREYGIQSAVDLKQFRDEIRKQKLIKDNRFESLRQRKDSAKFLLRHLITILESNAKEKRKIESLKYADERLRRKLIQEEAKLREKLLERRREFLRNESKGKLKSVANISNNVNVNSSPLNDNLIKVPMRSSLTLHTYLSQYSNSLSNHIHKNHYHFRSALYKNHKKGCKFYKPKSLVMLMRDYRND